MKRADDNTRAANASPETAGNGQNESIGLPWFRTWRDVYVFVISCFVLYVIVLAIFSRVFS